MPACPNCGRQTMRTLDWACQWCGYPLLSKSYKKIDKTFKQLQEERRLGLDSTEAEPEEKLEPEIEPEPEPELKPKAKPAPRPELKLQPQPKPRAEPELKPLPKPEPRPLPKPEIKMEPPAKAEQRTQPVPEPPPAPKIKAEPEAPPEPAPDPKLVFPKLEAASGQVKVSVDELNSAYQSDKMLANARLKDKVIKVAGIVGKIFIRDHLDIRYIVLTGARKSVWSIRCTFSKESMPLLSRLAEEQAVTVQGKYDGYGNNILMKDCTLVV